MANAHKLELPDGGTLDLPIPDDFGGPIFAASEPMSPLRIVVIGAIIGAAIGYTIYYFDKKVGG